MTKDVAIEWAKEQMEQYNCEGYVIISNTSNKSGTDYDFVVFSSYEDMKRYIENKFSYDFLDDDAYLRDDEFITDVYSKSHLIIL